MKRSGGPESRFAIILALTNRFDYGPSLGLARAGLAGPLGPGFRPPAIQCEAIANQKRTEEMPGLHGDMDGQKTCEFLYQAIILTLAVSLGIFGSRHIEGSYKTRTTYSFCEIYALHMSELVRGKL